MYKLFLFLAILLTSFTSFAQKQKMTRQEKKIATDLGLGQKSREHIFSKPAEYPILPESQYPIAYAELKRILKSILSSPEIKYRESFAYDSVLIIQRDDIINAFAAPGGYIYVYTGLLKYAENEDQLAGILAHEIAHAELRHGIKKLKRTYGGSAILLAAGIATGLSVAQILLVEILDKVVRQGYSRRQEAQADKYSVIYLSTNPNYSCTGCGDFFMRTLKGGADVKIPTFLSDHPNTKDRVNDIYAEGDKRKCRTTARYYSGFTRLVANLP